MSPSASAEEKKEAGPEPKSVHVFANKAGHSPAGP